MDDTYNQIELLKQQTELIKSLQQTIQQQNQTIAELNETVAYLKQKLFGASSEKSKSRDVEGQLSFFNEAEFLATPAEPEPTLKQAVGGYDRVSRKPKAKREDIIGNLPVTQVICEVSGENRICPRCGTELEAIGQNIVREELKLTPAKIERIQYVQKVYGCPECKKEDAYIVKAETPSPLLKHSLASPSTVAYVMYQKYVNSMPLYRQSKDWEQMNVKLSRATLANWVIKCGLAYLKPVWEHLHRHLVSQEFIHADETPCQVLKEEGKKPTSKSYMWVYRSGYGSKPVVLFEYQPSRAGEHAADFLKDFHGYLHCDGFRGYNKLTNVTRCGCWAHLRRYFMDALPKNHASYINPLPAEIGVDYCNQLFKIERKLVDCDPEIRKQKRLEHEVPVLKAFWCWLETLNVSATSKLGRAVTYAKNQKPYMENYLLDGRCSISNNAAENAIRPYTVGRKNYLFHDTPKGAEASAIIYSLVETAKANNLNIYMYLQTLLLYMPDYLDEPDGIESMMPWSERIRQTCSNKS